MSKRIAVLLPCYNEEKTIGDVVAGFREALPESKIYVYDNNSTDETVARAVAAGAIVGAETMQGKGNVIRRMFSDIDADVYVMADGDGTYHAPAAPEMVEELTAGRLDMVVGTRLGSAEDTHSVFRSGHLAGNRTLSGFVGWLFERRFTDILSGYRVMSRRFVKSFPAIASGFEIETELTIHALELRMPVAEVEVPYYSRPEGSDSKLRTWRDGTRILVVILFLYKEIKPFRFFGVLFLACTLISVILAYPLVVTFLETGLVPRFPTAILATGTMLFGVVLLACGMILDTVSRGRRESKRMQYLSIPPAHRD